MSKISNILIMLEYLSSGRKYSVKELSEKIEVSPRMIRFYKDEVEKAGIYIETIKGPYGGYILRQNINVPKRFVTPMQNTVNVKNKEVYNLINRAIKEKRKYFIEYFSKNGDSVSKRIIHPYDLIILGDEWGVASYCEFKEEIRHFYINRIKLVKILEKFDK